MASMNDWLGFSLSHQELPPPQIHQNKPSPAAVSRIVSGHDASADCFVVRTESSATTVLSNIPNLGEEDGPFDWNMKCFEFNGTSTLELSSNDMETDKPKLEGFQLGGNSFFPSSDQNLPPAFRSTAGVVHGSAADYMFTTASASDCAGGEGIRASVGGVSMSNSSMGLSMIKTWLRNQPALLQQQGSVVVDDGGGDIVGMNGLGGGAASSTGNAGWMPLDNRAKSNLSLSMSTESQSSSPSPLLPAWNRSVDGGGGGRPGGNLSPADDHKKSKNDGSCSLDVQSGGGAIEAVQKKSIDTFGQRTSIYRGVTRHRWTGRYEAHLWDNSCRREGQTRKGRQVYLGGYDKEEKAARAYDLAALKYWGTTTTTNFPVSNYEKELGDMEQMNRQEFVASLRRKSSGFSRGASIYRGVTRHHQHGRWQARIGRVAGNKDLYLGTFSTQEEAAEAYDIAAIKFRGLSAVTNFVMSRYDVESILESSSTPPVGAAAAKRLKGYSDGNNIKAQLIDGSGNHTTPHHGWGAAAAVAGFLQAPHFPAASYRPYGYGRQDDWTCQLQEQDTMRASTSQLQDIRRLRLGSAVQNMFVPPAALLQYNLGSQLPEAAAASTEQPSGSSASLVYGNGINYYRSSCSIARGSHDGFSSGASGQGSDDNENLFFSGAPPYSAKVNAADYLAPPPCPGAAGASGYDGTAASDDSWAPTAARVTQQRPGNLGGAVCHGHGGPLFSLWNDA